VRPGELVLIWAAGSGVGLAGLQIAKLFGATVIATASSDAKLARARELGADHVLHSRRDDFVDALKQISRRGVDVVFEHTGAATWPKSILSAARGGRIVTCGATSGFDAKTDIRHVFFRQLQIFGENMESNGDLL